MKTIKGTWFEFKHHNVCEGKYWNPVCRKFTEEQWRAKIKEMHDIGMEYLVLLCASLVYEDSAEAYFETDIYPFPEDMACANPIEVMLDQCDKLGMKVFMSSGYYGPCTNASKNMVSEEVTRRAFGAMEELWEKFGSHKSFYGWYYPDETGAGGLFSEEFISYVNAYSEQAHRIAPHTKTLVAPYGTRKIIADEAYIDQLRRLDVDFIAYQDEVGVRKSTPEETGAYYRALREAHDKAGRSALWADVELFDFEGGVYVSALIPSDMERVKRQLEAVSPYVDVILCYQYMGMMNEPSTVAYCGHPDSVEFYSHYRAFLEKTDKS